jgi:hypothetical protein
MPSINLSRIWPILIDRTSLISRSLEASRRIKIRKIGKQLRCLERNLKIRKKLNKLSLIRNIDNNRTQMKKKSEKGLSNLQN